MSDHLGPKIGDLLAGRLTTEEQRGFEEHVKSCKECASELSLARELREQALRQGVRHIPAPRIFELAGARHAVTPAESEHLSACADCEGEIQWAEGLPASGDAGEDSESEADPASGRPRKEPDRANRDWLWAGLAAAAALVVLLLIPQDGATDLSGLASIKPLPVKLSRSVPAPDSFEEHRLLSLEAYAGADYPSATEHLSNALALHTDDPEMLLYLGSIQLLRGDTGDSVERFERARENATDSVVKEEAGWQLANALLMANRNDDAEQVLKEIASGEGHRRNDAAALLESIQIAR
jgi:tetratricopeptide (TPR) repeat protein